LWGKFVKLKIEMTPEGPELSEIEGQLNALNPPLSSGVKTSLMQNASMVREKLHFNAVNNTGISYHQSQTLSDGNHRVTIVGRMSNESMLDKLKKLF